MLKTCHGLCHRFRNPVRKASGPIPVHLAWSALQNGSRSGWGNKDCRDVRSLPGPGDQPPSHLLPSTHRVRDRCAQPCPGASVCEWKGQASYWTLSSGSKTAVAAGWSYEHPHPDFQDIAGHIAVYAGYMDECRVAGERVTPQPGGFYGGWITAEVVGPFKGEPGSLGW
ncbi:DUF427 domain-containing protein [Deinococcus malanensis]|uniref:DUF427 domain-containing protein n=1 Tax=Deinococcus malanensis TaxID=1706855 RepID=UPI003626055B